MDNLKKTITLILTSKIKTSEKLNGFKICHVYVVM